MTTCPKCGHTALPAPPNDELALSRIAHLASDALRTDGAHHKQWYLAQIIAIADMLMHDAIRCSGCDMGIAP
jgi:hypothetical protein